jgi:hypothetical protein
MRLLLSLWESMVKLEWRASLVVRRWKRMLMFRAIGVLSSIITGLSSTDAVCNIPRIIFEMLLEFCLSSAFRKLDRSASDLQRACR